MAALKYFSIINGEDIINVCAILENLGVRFTDDKPYVSFRKAFSKSTQSRRHHQQITETSKFKYAAPHSASFE